VLPCQCHTRPTDTCNTWLLRVIAGACTCRGQALTVKCAPAIRSSLALPGGSAIRRRNQRVKEFPVEQLRMYKAGTGRPAARLAIGLIWVNRSRLKETSKRIVISALFPFLSPSPSLKSPPCCRRRNSCRSSSITIL
jgi:hypothetical protein